MPKSIRHPLVAVDIAEALRASLENFGRRQYYRYRNGIEAALEHLCAYPQDGFVFKPEPRYRLFPIRRRGLRARHQFVYAVEDDGTVVVLRLLHDRMEVREHIPEH